MKKENLFKNPKFLLPIAVISTLILSFGLYFGLRTTDPQSSSLTLSFSFDISATSQIFPNREEFIFKSKNALEWNKFRIKVDPHSPLLLKEDKSVVHHIITKEYDIFCKNRFLLAKLQDTPFVPKLLWTGEISKDEALDLHVDEAERYLIALEAVKDPLLLVSVIKTADAETYKKYLAQFVAALRHFHAYGIKITGIDYETVWVANDQIIFSNFENAEYQFSTNPKASLFSAPELYLEDKAVDLNADIFTLGVFALVFLSEDDLVKKLKKCTSENDLKNNIVNLVNEKTKSDAIADAVDLCRKMLQPDQTKRITLEDIMKHEFFKGVNWETYCSLKAPVPITEFKFTDVATRKELIAKGDQHQVSINSSYQMTDFTIGNLLGSGGFAQVLKGIDLKTNRPVAIKVSSSSFDSAKLFFAKEIYYLNRLRYSPYICKLIWWTRLSETEAQSFFKNKQMQYVLVLEFVGGGELIQQFITGKWKDEEAQKWMAQMVIGLQHMQAHGIIHRDLKTENVLLTSAGDVKICDFGFSRRFKPVPGGKATGCGSDLYMSPETLTTNETASYPRDVFALGVIFYHFLTPNYDFEKNQPSEPHSTWPVREDVSNDAENLYRAMVHSDPKKRFTITQIMQSPYFKGINWRSLGALEAPI